MDSLRRALQAIVDIRPDLLSREEAIQVKPPAPIMPEEEKPRPRTFRGHFPRQTNAFQRGCQRRKFWTPVH
jgi:hypothetical protein